MGKRRKNKWAVRRGPKERAPTMTLNTVLSPKLTKGMSKKLITDKMPPVPIKDYSLQLNDDTMARPAQIPTAITVAKYELYLELRKKGLHKGPSFNTSLLRNRFAYKHGQQLAKYYFISPTSYDYLVSLARKFKYARYITYIRGGRPLHNQRQTGISQFVRELANPDITWEDTRDTYMKSFDQERIEQGLPPMWIEGPRGDQLRRTLHKLIIPQQTEDTLYKLALSHMIINRFRPTLDKVPVVGFLLEVIGNKYLVPHNVRTNPVPHKRPYREPAQDFGANLMTGEGWRHD